MFLVPATDDPLNAEVKRLVIRPGDRLVIKVDHYITDDEWESIKASVERAFDGADYVPKVLILEAGMEIGVIGPAEGEDS